MRRLIHIPIIHNAADLGSLSTSVQSHYAKLCGEAAWGQREEIVTRLWRSIESQLDALALDATTTRIYQDGLPICGFEDRIVHELAAGGSSNHQLILKWIGRGATLMGTENAKLLLEEYDLQKQLLSQATGAAAPLESARTELARLLTARDAFIAERIAATLQPDETGLLFLGALHRLDPSQLADIQFETLGDGSHKTVRRPRA
jgi:hypothetical protein